MLPIDALVKSLEDAVKEGKLKDLNLPKEKRNALEKQMRETAKVIKNHK